MRPQRAITAVAVLALSMAACASAAGKPSEDPEQQWSADPAAGSAWHSGITIGALPDGYLYVESQGTGDGRRSALYHLFADESGHEFMVGRQLFPAEFPLHGEVIATEGDREYRATEGGNETRVSFLTPEQVRIEVASASLPVDILLGIAETLRYDAVLDRPA